MTEATLRMGLATYFEDGTVELALHPVGTTEQTHRLPLAFLPRDQQWEHIRLARRDFWLRGYTIVRDRWVKNPVFDPPSYHTTREFVLRACQNPAEAENVVKRISREALRVQRWEPPTVVPAKEPQ